MNKAFNWIRRKYHEIYVAFLFITAIFIIVLLFPGEAKFKYEYQEGKPWTGESLFAPFDFPIHKTQGELAYEKDSIVKNLVPYFKLDENIYTKQLTAFSETLDKKWSHYIQKYNEERNKYFYNRVNKADPDFFTSHQKLIFAFLEEQFGYVYNRGIIKIPDKIKADEKEFAFRVVSGNTSEEYDISEVFTVENAMKYITTQIREWEYPSDKYDKKFIAGFISGIEIEKFLLPNLTLDQTLTDNFKENALNDISLTRGMIQANEEIIRKGDLVDDEKYKILESFRIESENRMKKSESSFLILLGHAMLIFFSILVIFLFLYNFRRDILQHARKTSFILIIMLMFVALARLLFHFKVEIYVIPFTILPIIVRTFYDSRLALFVHIITILVIALITQLTNPFEFVFIQIITGIVSIFSLANVRKRVQIFYAALFISLSYSILYFAISITIEGNLENLENSKFGYFGLNGIFVLISYPLIYLFERLFGFLSDVSLMEISDTNSKLLRKLAEKAPGTFQHSFQVAALAEEVIYKIGGNPFLVRTGALYHDIGKINMPMYFIENQNYGINPHDTLEFDQSAEIIISHVNAGVELAKKHRLPSQITDFILTHHGDLKVQYFYKNYIKKFPESHIDLTKFTYPGPKPFSRETAVLMMADSVEAASRSLKVVTEQSINELVEKIIDYQLNEKQFENVDITFRDITIAKEVLKTKLKNIYHTRIEYPK